MAVEAQTKLWMFIGTEEDFADSSDSDGPDGSDGHHEVTEDDGAQVEDAPESDDVGIEVGYLGEEFAVHFLHDVESVYWLYVWFLHRRTPSQAGEDSTEKLENIKAEVAASWMKYFSCGIEGNATRRALIGEGSRGARQLKQMFKPLYRWCPSVLKPLFFQITLRKEYKNLQLNGHRRDKYGRWRLYASAIGDNAYEVFTKCIMEAEEGLPEGPQLVASTSST